LTLNRLHGIVPQKVVLFNVNFLGPSLKK
jgi:hypothetical protein